MRLGYALRMFRGFEALDMDDPEPCGGGGITSKQFWNEVGQRYDAWIEECRRSPESARLRFTKRAFCSALREGQSCSES